MRRMGAPGARYNVLDDDDHALIVALFADGLRVAEIAPVIGCTVGGVYATLVRAGLHVPVHGKVRRNSPRLAAARAGLGR